jgi:ABC-type amino acid transport system permease subunit
LLAGGPKLGPAVLFWSYLAVIILAAFALGHLSVTPVKTWQWLLLGLGLTQVPALLAIIIVGWLLALGLREQQPMPQSWPAFNAVQIGIVILTLIALWALFTAVKAGLVGMPKMQISGNQSTARVLNWTQDYATGVLPQPWVLSLSVWIYRILMLVWSLWLALALLGWLKWGWHCITKDGGWRKIILPWPKKKPAGKVT